MKVTKLTIHNVGLIADTVIELNKPLILFYGEIRQGKTTILNGVRWCFGGAFPSDIIRHGEKEAFVQLDFDGGCIRREWYRAKDETTKARDVQFVRNGKPVPSPVGEIKRFLNPFLLDQDFFRNKSELERKQYFTELFAVDTTALDTEQFNRDREAVQLRAKIKGYGEIDLKEVKPVDATALKAELDKIRQQHEQKCNSVETFNSQARADNAIRESKSARLESTELEIADLEKRLSAAKKIKEELQAWLKDNRVVLLQVKPLAPDTTVLEARISDAAANNVRADQYQANKRRSDEKATDEKSLSVIEARLREIKKEKTAKLKGVSESCGIEGLAFDESGNFTYEGTQAGMLSTSQIMKLSSALSDLYPEGFGVDLLDRGESLGKSIFGFIERAQKEEKTILATIVGEKPAQVPENVGVFVVEGGKVKA